jgi:phosphopantothenoylcysteine decarboxylase/phosphopantothenate--cysteine ligase
MFEGKKIVIGITGSIAAYKIPLLVRLLVRENAEVKVIMTPAAADFVTPLTLATLSNNPVIIEPFNKETGSWNNHVELGRWADAMVFAPVTANTLGKMVNGIADNFAVTAYLSAKCPVFIAPAMDLDMYKHPATQRSIEYLRSYGNIIIEPQVGELASGLTGPGRLEEPEKIFQILKDYFRKSTNLSKKKVLVTAGPTYEKFDPVRFIGNYSSGLMGISLANEAALRGALVTLITGPTHLTDIHAGIHCVHVESADEMHAACLSEFPDSDIILMAAAVADYKPVKTHPSKVKKNSGNLLLELMPTPDILADLGKKRQEKQILAGFALETNNETGNAIAKLKAKNLDYIILNSLNDQGAGFGHKTNKVTIFDREGRIIPIGLKSKQEVASEILDLITKQKPI